MTKKKPIISEDVFADIPPEKPRGVAGLIRDTRGDQATESSDNVKTLPSAQVITDSSSQVINELSDSVIKGLSDSVISEKGQNRVTMTVYLSSDMHKAWKEYVLRQYISEGKKVSFQKVIETYLRRLLKPNKGGE